MASSYSATSDSPRGIIYKTKEIQFFGRTTRIILQNENGPCLLIAISNVLLLRKDMCLNPYSFEVSQENLLSLVAETLIELNINAADNKEEEYIEKQQQQNITDAMDLLPCLPDGINVDLKFRRIDDFEFTPEMAIFKLLKIHLYHGWIVDPQDWETAAAIGSKSYNALLTELVALENDQSSQICGEYSVDTSAAVGVPSQSCLKTRSFDDSPRASSEHRRSKTGDIEEEIALLQALQLSKRAALGFDTHRDSSSGKETVSEFSDESQMCEDDTPVDSFDASAVSTSILGSNICQLSKIDDQLFSRDSEDRADCDIGNEINVGEEISPKASTTKCSGALEHETVFDVETENISKMTVAHVTYSEDISMENPTNLESNKIVNISETPLKSEAVTVANPDLTGRSQDDKCVSSDFPVNEVKSLLGKSSSEESDTNRLTPREGEVIKNFLNSNANQLTFPGLFYLVEGLEEGELCVFFRNNHFATMLKHENELYVLVTDQGYLTHPDVVWEELKEVNGDSRLMTGGFKLFEFKSDSRKWDEENADSFPDFMSMFNISPEEGTKNDPDLNMTVELLEQGSDDEKSDAAVCSDDGF